MEMHDFPWLIAFYAFAMLVALFWAIGVYFWTKQKTILASWQPTVSIIVVGRNEEDFVCDCINSIVSVDYPRNILEICFVDDHSTDKTHGLASELAEKHGNMLRVCSAPDCPPAIGPKKNALSFGIAQTTGEILLFADADNSVPTGWVKAMISEYDAQTGAVAGFALPTNKVSLTDKLYFLERLLTNYTSISAIGWGSPASVCGQNLSYRRIAYEQIGGIAHPDTASGDDDLTVQAIAKQGWSIRFCRNPQSVVADHRPTSLYRELNTAVRHQSTVKHYPIYWRFAYILTIFSYVLLAATLLYSLTRPELLVFFAGFMALKTTIDVLALRTVRKRLSFALTLPEILLAELLLPVYVVVKPALAFVPAFSWHGRSHKNTLATQEKAG
jgi:cellulose synthase/poly-beta-1,6-N-acetylglucosamine synthase-like glycosyltransferase